MITSNVFVIGAGMAGLTCANHVSSAGMDVVCADKARGSGGRLSSKRLQKGDKAFSFDLGALSFQAHTSEFKQALSHWQTQGLVAHWQEHQGSSLYVGVPRSSSMTRFMAEQIPVHFSTRISQLRKEGDRWNIFIEQDQSQVLFAQSECVVLASPVAQTFQLLPQNHELRASLEGVEIFPQWVMMLALDYPLDIPAYTVNPCQAIECISLENSKPQRDPNSGAYLYCIQASSTWSQQYIDEPHDVIQCLLTKELELALQTQVSIQHAFVHRWLYSQGSCHGHQDAGFLGGDDGLYVCGDYLLSGLNLGGVESAYLSGNALGQYLIQQYSDVAKVG